ncbi:PIN domain-containing protein [Halorhabdus sp. CBA1104]|uniref:PIN domain-containing protein n=1 Tax=unclassified Halorhabdus TaxID=2621901 RepID=UPI0012B32A67|nr:MULTISPECIES: PIN domain-containing protein [unclassified Halorhabdus]QGN06509.1 PIN domain-containing protein [Halorhabdus sp. CBA1104]
MTLYDSSVLIDYLDGKSETVAYVEDHHDRRAVAPQLVVFEVYQGEVFTAGPADFEAVDRALSWVDVVEAPTGAARSAAEVQATLHERGDALAPRDAFIAGMADRLGERLAVADADFDVAGLTDVLDVDFV